MMLLASESVWVPFFQECRQQHYIVACRLWFTCLHLTYFNFLFPVLADNEAVVYGAIVSFSLHMKDLGAISKANPTTRQDGLAEELFTKALQLITSVVCPLLFALLLSFNHWSYNHGMFFMLLSLIHI